MSRSLSTNSGSLDSFELADAMGLKPMRYLARRCLHRQGDESVQNTLRPIRPCQHGLSGAITSR